MTQTKRAVVRFEPLPFRERAIPPADNRSYLISAFKLAVPPSATSTSNSFSLPLPTKGCHTTTLCFPAGTPGISNEPSSFTTAW